MKGLNFILLWLHRREKIEHINHGHESKLEEHGFEIWKPFRSYILDFDRWTHNIKSLS